MNGGWLRADPHRCGRGVARAARFPAAAHSRPQPGSVPAKGIGRGGSTTRSVPAAYPLNRATKPAGDRRPIGPATGCRLTQCARSTAGGGGRDVTADSVVHVLRSGHRRSVPNRPELRAVTRRKSTRPYPTTGSSPAVVRTPSSGEPGPSSWRDMYLSLGTGTPLRLSGRNRKDAVALTNVRFRTLAVVRLQRGMSSVGWTWIKSPPVGDAQLGRGVDDPCWKCGAGDMGCFGQIATQSAGRMVVF
jgi:hypothetical protein